MKIGPGRSLRDLLASGTLTTAESDELQRVSRKLTETLDSPMFRDAARALEKAVAAMPSMNRQPETPVIGIPRRADPSAEVAALRAELRVAHEKDQEQRQMIVEMKLQIDRLMKILDPPDPPPP